MMQKTQRKKPELTRRSSGRLSPPLSLPLAQAQETQGKKRACADGRGEMFEEPDFDGRRLPDVRTCRIRYTGTAGPPDCAVPDSADCIYAMSYRYGFFCKNPLWRELKRIRREKPPETDTASFRGKQGKTQDASRRNTSHRTHPAGTKKA